jgi:selenocysteine-specific elongation factor
LPEEKARGITIDLGFAHLELPSPVSTSPIHVGIVDVPGHEDFVKNMVAGVGAIDLALLIVAADDGWMPQTEEHLQILSYFGVPRAVVSLTKADLAADEAASVSELRQKLKGSVFADAPIVPTSVVTGRGLDTLRTTLGARVVSRTSFSRHRQAETRRRPGVHADRSRHDRNRHLGRRTVSTRPGGGRSTQWQTGADPPDPVARSGCRDERSGHTHGAESGRCGSGRRRASWRCHRIAGDGQRE